MKKFLLILSALVMTASAFAQDAEGPKFKYNVWANAFYRAESTTTEDENYSFQNIRVRPKFTASLGNVSVVTRFEIDGTYGDDGSGDQIDKGYDEKDVEVKNIYIQVKDFIVPKLTFKTGAAGYSFPMAFSDDCAITQLKYDAGVAKIDLAYVVLDEGSTDNNEQDGGYVALKAGINAGPAKVTPAFLYGMNGPDSDAGYYNYYIGALDVAVDQGPLSIALTFAYGAFETQEDGATDEGTGYAVDLGVDFKVSPMMTVSVFGSYYSGDDGEADGETEDFYSVAKMIDEIEAGGRMILINDAQGAVQVATANGFEDTASGLMLFGIGASMKMGKIKATANVAYAEFVEETAAGDTALGTEIDLKLGYSVAPKTTLWAEIGYLMAGDGLGTDPENPMMFQVGVKTSI